MIHFSFESLAFAAAVLVLNAPSGDAATAPFLGDCTRFALHGHAGVAASGTETVIYGDIGGDDAITGFSTALSGPHVHQDENGYAVYGAGAPESIACAAAKQIAYDTATAEACTKTVSSNLAGLPAPLTPGVYCNDVFLLGTTGVLTLDGGGDPDSVFIFKAETTVITATNTNVVLVHGAQAKNVFWVAGSAINLAGYSTFQGNLLAHSAVTLGTGCDLIGRALANTASVTLAGINVVRKPELPINDETDETELHFAVHFDATKLKGAQGESGELTVTSSENGFVASFSPPLMCLHFDQSQVWFAGFTELPEPFVFGGGRRRRMQTTDTVQTDAVDYSSVTFVQAMLQYLDESEGDFFADGSYDYMRIQDTPLCKAMFPRYDLYLERIRTEQNPASLGCPMFDKPYWVTGDRMCMLRKTATCFQNRDSIYACIGTEIQGDNEYVSSCVDYRTRRRLQSSTKEGDRKQLRQLQTAEDDNETLFKPVVTVSSDNARENTIVRANVMFERGGYAIKTNNKCPGGINGHVSRNVEVRSSKADVSALDSTDDDCININTRDNCVEYQPVSPGGSDASDVLFPSLYGDTNDPESSLEFAVSLDHKGECLPGGSVTGTSYIADVAVTDEAPHTINENRKRSAVSMGRKDGTDGLDIQVVTPIFNRAVMKRTINVNMHDSKLAVTSVFSAVILFDSVASAGALLDEGDISVTIDSDENGFCAKVTGLMTSDQNGVALTTGDSEALPQLTVSAVRTDRVGTQAVEFSARVLPDCPQLTCFKYNAADAGNLELDTFRGGDDNDCQNLTEAPTPS